MLAEKNLRRFEARCMDLVESSWSVIEVGNTKTRIEIRSGVRQGCSITLLLFALAIDPLSERIEQSPKIKCIMIEEVNLKVSMYVDNTAGYVYNSLDFRH